MSVKQEVRHILKDWGCLRDFSDNDENSVLDAIIEVTSNKILEATLDKVRNILLEQCPDIENCLDLPSCPSCDGCERYQIWEALKEDSG